MEDNAHFDPADQSSLNRVRGVLWAAQAVVLPIALFIGVQTWNLSERVAALESSIDLIEKRQSDIGARIEALPAVMETEFQALGESGDAQSDRLLRSVSTVERIVRDQSVQIDALTRGLNENRARLDSLVVRLLPTGSLPSRGIGDPVDWGTPQYAPADSLNE